MIGLPPIVTAGDVLAQEWGIGKAQRATLPNIFSGPHLPLIAKFRFKKAQYFVSNLTTFMLSCFSS